jgi:micrococcal nuclease
MGKKTIERTMRGGVIRRLIFLIVFAQSLPIYAAQVIRIADGDTLTVLEGHRQVKIRLANIDAPEKRQAYGNRSRQNLAALCFRKDATYEIQDKDHYGRVVAVVTCNGVNVNRHQVETGMAWVYRKHNMDISLLTLEQEAREMRRGLWADSDPSPPWDFRKKKMDRY